MPKTQKNHYQYEDKPRIKCPHCDLHYDPYEDNYEQNKTDLFREHDDLIAIECPGCNKSFYTTVAIIFEYSTYKDEEEYYDR